MVLNKSFKVLRRWRPSRSVLLESKTIPEESLLFESGTLSVLSPAEADLIKKEYPDVDSAYGCLGVLQGEGFLYLVLITGCVQTGKIGSTEVYRITKTVLIPLHSNPNQHEGVVEMGKLLACGQFYFSVGEEEDTGHMMSLMARAQRRDQEHPEFHWNRSLFVYLQRFNIDCSKWLLPVMCGSVLIQTVYAGNKQIKTCLISRMSCERTGTRFNVRGLDDEGHVANFVETEQVLYVDNSITSFVQVRGLVPVFWDQPGIQTGTNRIRLSRGYHSSHPAFERHFEHMLKEYGPTLCLDLLGNRDMEPLLTEAFVEHLEELSIAGAAQYIHFDYHLHCRPGHIEALESILLPQCEDFLTSCGFFLEVGGVMKKAQTGILRHNCLDCLDRSNNAQALIGLMVLRKQLEDVGVVVKPLLLSRFVEQYKTFWVQNGDNISRFYAGTRALDGKTKVGKLRDGARSVQRTFRNNFLDSTKQEAIDILLLSGYVGEVGWKTRALLSYADALAPLPVRKALCNNWLDFTSREKLRVCIGTWNVNGGKHIRSVALKNQSLHDWLLDAPHHSGKAQEHPEDFQRHGDIYAIGFQELVGLTASNLVATSSTNRHEWAAELQRVLSRDEHYSLLTAEQLVGVCLYIFIKPYLVPFIRDVAVSSVKTGIGGKAGNKGAVVIRLLLHSTSLCFVCSHFAAHQTKIIERNHDFEEICKKVQFPLGQTIDSHDYVFWCGDLNYRIDLPGSLAKDAISKRDWEKLHRHDQLIKQKKLGKVFQGFSEGLLDFAPTFKYDMFSDDYDTSEKARVPAWCDRVLWKRKSFLPPSRQMARLREEGDIGDTRDGEYGWQPSTVQKVYERELTSEDPALQWWHPGRLLYYGRAELKTSDHRPILAVLEVDVFRANEKKREQCRQDTLRKMGPPDATVIVTPEEEETNCVDNSQLVATMQQYGDIILVRSTDACTLVTYSQPEAAVAALEHSGKQINNTTVYVELKQLDYSVSADDRVNILTKAHLSKYSGIALATGGGVALEEEKEEELEFTEGTEGEESPQEEDIGEDEEDEEEEEGQGQLEPPEKERVSITPPLRPPPPVTRRGHSPKQQNGSSVEKREEFTESVEGEEPSCQVGEGHLRTEKEEIQHWLEPPERGAVSTAHPSRPTRPPPPTVTGRGNSPKQNGSPVKEELSSSSSSQEEGTTSHPQRQVDTSSPLDEGQVYLKPRVPPSRPPPICTRSPERLPKPRSPETMRPQRPLPPPQPSRKRPIPKPRSHTYDPSSSSVARSRPNPPSRPPPPYVSLYPEGASIKKHEQFDEERFDEGPLEKVNSDLSSDSDPEEQ